MSGTPRPAVTDPSRQLDEAMDDRLRMDEHVELIRLQAEKVVGLDQFQPLFIRLAESMLIFDPIDQTGCAAASAGVAAAIRSRGQVRNGPPEAVRVIATTSSDRPGPSAWSRALCSESTGRISTPRRARARP